MKKKSNIDSAIGIASLGMSILSVAAMIWIGAFKFSALEHNVEEINRRLDKVDSRLDKMDNRLDRMDEKLNNIDIRVNILEHRKP